jgi:hypothetical protein
MPPRMNTGNFCDRGLTLWWPEPSPRATGGVPGCCGARAGWPVRCGADSRDRTDHETRHGQHPCGAPNAMVVAADTVAQCLLDSDTRADTLESLELHATPIPTPLAMAAAPALFEMLLLDASALDRGTFDRVALLLARLEAEAPLDDGYVLHGAAFGDGGYEKLFKANNIAHAALRKPASELTKADATSYACLQAYDNASLSARGFAAPWHAAGLTERGFIKLWMGLEPIVSKKLMPSDDVPRKMLTLLLDLIQSNELSADLAIGGAWTGVKYCCNARPGLVATAVESGMFEVAVACLNAIGSPADWVSISRDKAARACELLGAFAVLYGGSLDQASRCLSSGLFDLCVAGVEAVAAAGVDGLRDTHHSVLYYALSAIRNCCMQPACESKIRAAAGALGFCLTHDLDIAPEIGLTTGGCAAQICEPTAPVLSSMPRRASHEITRVVLHQCLTALAGCGVFGRDEGGSDFNFTPQHVETL